MSASKAICKMEIFVAIEYGDIEQVQRMISAFPCLVHIKCSNGWTPIMLAARYG